tara:strand:- start:252 stop:1568 length:1317 start_codon:yes stop_codon:yes gene_type:complete
MALSGFLVPFASGALIKRQEIADEYDDTAGEIIDAASAKYNEKLSLNNKAIELQNANYAAVENALGTTVAEAAAKNGFLNNVNTNEVVNYVTKSMPKGLVNRLQNLTMTEDKKGFLTKDGEKQLFDSVFKDDYNKATSKLGNQKDWASKNLNKGAIKNVSDLYLSGGEELPAPTGIEKAQKFLFGDRITNETGATFNLAAEEAIGSNVDVQPNAVMASSSLAERVGYKPAVDLGSILNQDRAIAAILNADDIKLAPDGSGIIFPARFNNHVLAIKDNAQKYALEYTDADGKTVDIANLMLRSNQDIENNIISPISKSFLGYAIDTAPFAATMSFRVMKATDIDFSSEFMKNNSLTEKDFIKAKHTRNDINNKNSDIVDGFTLSTKAADSFEEEIKMQESTQLRAVYIDYLPDNMHINLNGIQMPIKTYYRRLFGIARF